MRKVLFIFSIFVLAAGCSTGGDKMITGGITQSGDYYSQALKAAQEFEKSNFMDNESYQRSVRNFEEVLVIEKVNADAWYNFGRVLFYNGEFMRAREALKNAVRYRKNFVEAYLL
ncbi:MAG: tetratricopeptide repeat protein, partial [Pseudomonadota bacterium]